MPVRSETSPMANPASLTSYASCGHQIGARLAQPQPDPALDRAERRPRQLCDLPLREPVPGQHERAPLLGGHRLERADHVARLLAAQGAIGCTLLSGHRDADVLPGTVDGSAESL